MVGVTSAPKFLFGHLRVDSIWRNTFAIAYVLIDQSRNLFEAVEAGLLGHGKQPFVWSIVSRMFAAGVFWYSYLWKNEKACSKRHTAIVFPCLSLCKSRWTAVRQRIEMKTLALWLLRWWTTAMSISPEKKHPSGPSETFAKQPKMLTQFVREIFKK